MEMNLGQLLLIVLWAVLALAAFASAIFVPMALVWKIVNFAFGIYNTCIVLGFGWLFNKKERQE